MHASRVQSPAVSSTHIIRRLAAAFLAVALVLVGGMFAAIRIRLVTLEARALSTQVVEERTVNVAFDAPVSGTGWSEPEAGFTWSIAPAATVHIQIIPGWYRVEFEAAALTDDILDSLVFRVNGQVLDLIRRRAQNGFTRYEGVIPPDMLAENTMLTLAVSRVISPQALNGRPDARELGVRVAWLRLRPILAPETVQNPALYGILLLGAAVAAGIVVFMSDGGPIKRAPLFAVLMSAAALVAVLVGVVLPEIAVAQLVYFLVFVALIAVITILWTPSAYASGGKSLVYHLTRLWDNRVLLFIWTRYNILSRYSQAFLGILWIIIQPLATAAILALVFSRILRAVDTGGVPFISFYLAAVIPWILFSAGLSNGMMSLIGASGLIEQVYFPREIVVLVKLGETLVDVSFTFVAMLAINALVGIYPNWHFVYLPLLLLIQVALMMGLMFFTSYLSMMIRDVPQLVTIVLQFMFYLTPILYPIGAIPAELKFIALVNPLAPVVDAYRSVILYNTAPDFTELYYTIVMAGVLLYSGYMFFKKHEKRVADFI